MSDRLRMLLDSLQRRLENVPADRVIVVIRGIAITIDDYLATRIVKLVVHHDDLVASIGGAGVPPPPDAVAFVVELLVAAGRRARGDLAVLRALTRGERDAVAALRIL